MRRAKLLLVGSNNLSLICLRSLFTDSLFTVISEFSDIAMLNVGAFPDPDVALVETMGEIKTAMGTLERLDQIYPATPVVILNDKVCLVSLAACLAAGASGFLTKDISLDALLKSLQLVILGEKVFPTNLAGLLMGRVREQEVFRDQGDNPCRLSGREMETVQYLVQGESNKEIAKRLSITEATIKVHMKSVMRKIKANNRTQVAIWAHSHFRPQARDAVWGSDGEIRFDAT